MTDSVLARVAALKTTPTSALTSMWRDLFETEPPPYNRRFLEHRLAYRIQELAYGGLKPLAPFTDQDNCWKNRRVELLLVKPQRS